MEDKELIAKYRRAVEVIKKAVTMSQSSALGVINKTQLMLYFAIGRYISLNSRNAQWGSGALSYISESLSREMPGLRGFSETNLRLMRTFYEQWSFLASNSSVATDEIQLFEIKEVFELALKNDDNERHGPLFSSEVEFSKENFCRISFSHHNQILTKVKDLHERIYYINLSANETLSVSGLKKAIMGDDYHHRGQMPNNFSETLSPQERARRAILSFKDEYLLDFINAEEFGARDIEEVDEKLVENKIINNVKNFLMTFGKDFTFVGSQYKVEAKGVEHFIDLVFYHRGLSCLVAVELKMGAFKTIYLGQLQSYLQVLDDFERKPNENPSIGIILCRDVNKSYAEYVISEYKKPMGIATFKTIDDLPEKLRKSLPDLDDLRRAMQ